MSGNPFRFTGLALIGGALMLSACATGPTMAGSQADFDRAYADASASFQRSEAADHAWSTAEDALKDAKKAAEAGDYSKATQLANLAKEHSELALEQAQREEQPDTTLP